VPLDIDVPPVVGDQSTATDERDLRWDGRDVAHRQLASDRWTSCDSRSRGAEYLIEICGDDTAVRRSRWPLVAARDHDRRSDAVWSPEATYMKSCGVRRATAEAVVERVDGARSNALFVESREPLAKRFRQFGVCHGGECTI
jgi:hypothetical protein